MSATTSRTTIAAAPARAEPRYTSTMARLANSALYAATLGKLLESRAARLAMLTGVPVLWLVFMHVGPIYEMFRISLLRSYPVESGSGFTLSNYRLFFSEPLYFLPLLRSFIFAAGSTALTLVIVYPVAYYVAKVVRPTGRSRALLLLLLPMWAGELIRTFSIIMLLANRGAINVLLREIGLIDRPIIMLYTPLSLAMGIVYLICLYMLLPLYSAFEKIPPQLLDAAADLGAGPVTRFRRIILPLSRDGIVSGCSLVFLTSMGVFATPMLLGGAGTALFSETIGTFFIGSSDKWPVGAAFAMIMLVSSLAAAGGFMWLVGGKQTRFI